MILQENAVYIPRNVRGGISKISCRYPQKILSMGGDTETCMGKIEMIQICDYENKVHILRVNPSNALIEFIRLMDKLTKKNYVNVIWFHNLHFDMEVMLIPYEDNYLLQSNLRLEVENAVVELHLGKVCFGKIIFSKNRVLQIRDSSLFFQGSLEKMAISLNTPHKKMSKPQGLGVRSPFDKDILEYAINDAIVTKEIGDYILENLFKKYDVNLCVSFSHFSQKLFQKNYIPDGWNIPFPPDSCVEISELSYHGGKNGLYIPVPAILPNVYEIDLISAYAYSLRNMINPFNCEYVYINEYQPGIDGVYMIDAEILPFKYPFIFHNRNFKQAVGKVEGLCITGYELDRALSLGLIKLYKCRGWYVRPTEKITPFSDYVDYWWEKKKNAVPKSVEYRISKLSANALYGKFIGKVETDKTDYIQVDGHFLPNIYKYVASSFYNPFFATLITAKMRLRLLDLEIKYKALHSATDSVKSFIKPTERKELGGEEIDVYGHCIIIRNKFYLHFNQEGTLEKFALHGFWGTINELINMIREQRSTYKCQHMFKLKESKRFTNLNPVPFLMSEVERSISNDLRQWYYIKGDRISKVTNIFETEIKDVIII